MRLSAGPILTSGTLDAILRAALPKGRKPPPFFSHCTELFFDLSRVCVVEYSAAAQILLLAEAACRAGVPVRVDLPDPLAGDLERPKTSRAVTNAGQRRRGVLTFLRTIGFISAIHMPHLPAARTRINGDHGNETHRGNVLPFHWLATADHQTLHRSQLVADTVRRLHDLGCPLHAGRVFLHELMENIAQHAAADDTQPAPHALVGGISLDPGTSGWQMLDKLFPELVRSAAATCSPVLRLIVGDSGAGLANRLEPHLPQTEWSEIPAGQDTWLTNTESATIWSLTRWSTSDPTRGASRRDGTGLWQVRQAVRQCGGGLLVRSADAFAGLELSERAADLLRLPHRAHTVGTLVDISVLPRGSRHVHPAGANGGPGRLGFEWSRVTADDASLARLHATACRTPDDADPPGLILTLESGSAQPMSGSRLAAVLTDAARIATRSVVAVLGAGVHPDDLRSAVDLFHRHPYTGAPFLLIDLNGRSAWCGGTDAARELLDRVADDPAGSLPVTGGVLGADSQLLLRQGADLQLAITATEALDVLRALVAERLRAHVERAGPGVDLGRFRTPTLQVTDRWVEVDTVLRDVVGMATAGFLLAHQMVRNDGPMAAGTQILRVATASAELTQAIARSAGITANVELIIDEFDSSAEQLHHLRMGKNVVLCADLMLTENSVRRALAESLNWGATPVAVVVPLDARENAGPLDSMEILNIRLPVWSLARIAVATPTNSDRPPVDIDPVLRSIGSTQHPVDRYYGWDPDEFLDAATLLPRAMSLGHVGRPAHRHFTVCFDVGPLLADEDGVQQQLIDKMVDVVVAWRTESGGAPPDRQIVVCHPDRPDENAGVLALFVCQALRERLPGDVAVTTRPVARAVLGSRWAFPESLETLPQNADVLLVDWGSIDATTIVQMVRLVAEGGAGRILALVLVSQLQVHDERALTILRSVEGTRHDPDGRRTSVDVPLRIRFLTALGNSATPVGRCSLCNLREQLQRDLEDGDLPRLVHDHVEGLIETLRVRNREEVVGEPLDAFGAAIDREHVVAYVRLRISLLSAMRFTAERQRVADEIAALAAGRERVARGAAIRLLAAERPWLKLSPLRFADCREALARMGLEVATDPDADERLRVQAMIVLVTAAPDIFVRRLTDLWESSLDRPTLVKHLLYQLTRIVRRRRGDAPVPPGELRSQLVACRALLDHHDAGGSALRGELHWQLARMTFQVAQGELDNGIGPRQAWRTLREHYLDRLRRHSDAESAMTRLLLLLEDLDHMDDDFWAVVQRSWNTVESFLYTYLLPFLTPLSSVLSGPFAEEHFDTDKRRCLESLSSHGSVRYLTQLDNELLELREFRTHGTELARAELVEKVRVLYRTVLTAGPGPTGREEESLAVFLGRCPTFLHQTLRACVNDPATARLPLRVRVVADGPDVAVFCPDELLSNALTHLLENAGSAKHRPPGGAETVVDVEITVTVLDGTARVVVRNEGTVRTNPTGHGIASIQQKLLDFDGYLVPAAPTGRWTYEIELGLPVWAVEPWKE